MRLKPWLKYTKAFLFYISTRKNNSKRQSINGKEFDTYKVGTVANSCSTMHKIQEKEFTLEDFSTEHLRPHSIKRLVDTVEALNYYRDIYLSGGTDDNLGGDVATVFEPKDKDIWWQLIQLLPSSYNQTRNVMLNYEVLANIYKSRKNHKLDESSVLPDDPWIKYERKKH